MSLSQHNTLADYIAAQELEAITGAEWRILPLNAKPADKFQADMQLLFIGDFGVGRGSYAYGIISNDSRKLFMDGQEVRTSTIVQIYKDDDGKSAFIETRNTIYRLI